MRPPREFVIQVFDWSELHKVEDEDALGIFNVKRDKKTSSGYCLNKSLTYEANSWCCEDPAELPPGHWVIAYHVLDSVIESLNSITPRN